MTNLIIWINCITAITLVLSVAKYWYLGKGRHGILGLCSIQIFVSVLQIGYNIMVVQVNPDLWASYLYIPLLVFGIFAAIKGIGNA